MVDVSKYRTMAKIDAANCEGMDDVDPINDVEGGRDIPNDGVWIIILAARTMARREVTRNDGGHDGRENARRSKEGSRSIWTTARS